MGIEELAAAIDALTVVAGVLSVLAFTLFTVTARWWQTRSATASWVLHLVVMLLLAHFVHEGIVGQVYWRELALLALLCASLLYWVFVVIYKRWFWRDNPPEPHEHHIP